MTKVLSLQEAAAMLMQADDILVLTHKNPDGDAIGSALSITYAMRSLGKRCNASFEKPIASSYDIIAEGYEDQDFEPGFILSVDIASPSLLPESTKQYAGKVDLAIDHHGSNNGYAAYTMVDAGASSCCEIIFAMLPLLGVDADVRLGSCIYVGLATDTGCFKYSNTTASTHLTAAKLAMWGVDIATINSLFFEQKSRGRIEIERMALAGMEFTCSGRICIITITREMMARSGCAESEMEDLAGIPKGILGVEAGITLKEQKNGNFRISLRTKSLDAAKICRQFGGGGHLRAAGCECSGTPYDIKCALVSAVKEEMHI